MFSPAGAVGLAAALIAAAVAMLESPDLVPGYHDLFFTHYMTVLELVTFLGQFPLILLHETAHALAGRRLGLRTRLSVDRRLYYVVFVTEMDGLVTVPRRKRYVPMLAGMLTDLLVLAALILVADVTRRPGGALSLAGGVALAFAYMTLLRLAWQFFFYLQTDLYYVIVTVLGCVDLQGTARRVLRARLGRALRRPVSPDHLRQRAPARPRRRPLVLVAAAGGLGGVDRHPHRRRHPGRRPGAVHGVGPVRRLGTAQRRRPRRQRRVRAAQPCPARHPGRVHAARP